MSSLVYRNLTESEAFRRLIATQPYHVTSIDADRVEKFDIPAGGELHYNYAAKAVDDRVLMALTELAAEQQCIGKYRAILEGEVMNTGEGRMVLHHLTRGQLGGTVKDGSRDVGAFYAEQQKRIADFAGDVWSGKKRGSTGKPFKSVVQIGIGGSDLGPRAMYLALANYAVTAGIDPILEAHFISNVDPDDASEVLSHIDPETTLFILVSKSGTTQETLTNRAFVAEHMKKSGVSGLNPDAHMIAVTSETSPLAKETGMLDAFFIDDFIGGRYSSTSAVGGVVLSLAFGPEVFSRFLAGAHEADRLSLEEEVRRNAALTDALIGVWERNVLGYPSTAVLPYSQALHRFPAHLQQLDMESNGKSVNRAGKPIDYPTGPLVFGEPGTNGQHSFYQLLHQGTDIIPLQFVGFLESQRGDDVKYEGSSSQVKLNANLAAQIVAFARGKKDQDPNKSFAGNRPSSLIYGPRLSPESLGALLSHFENKVMFQGLIWNINSFDQEGVQLGKVLTKTILGGTDDALLRTYGALLGVNR